ncbi:hypothetical protein BCR44DRAFT_56557, partial [Catenaria anguillulae PL171]
MDNPMQTFFPATSSRKRARRGTNVSSASASASNPSGQASCPSNKRQRRRRGPQSVRDLVKRCHDMINAAALCKVGTFHIERRRQAEQQAVDPAAAISTTAANAITDNDNAGNGDQDDDTISTGTTDNGRETSISSQESNAASDLGEHFFSIDGTDAGIDGHVAAVFEFLLSPTSAKVPCKLAIQDDSGVWSFVPSQVANVLKAISTSGPQDLNRVKSLLKGSIARMAKGAKISVGDLVFEPFIMTRAFSRAHAESFGAPGDIPILLVDWRIEDPQEAPAGPAPPAPSTTPPTPLLLSNPETPPPLSPATTSDASQQAIVDVPASHDTLATPELPEAPASPTLPNTPASPAMPAPPAPAREVAQLPPPPCGHLPFRETWWSLEWRGHRREGSPAITMCFRCFAHFAAHVTGAPSPHINAAYWDERRASGLALHAYLFQVMKGFDFVTDEYLLAVQYATHIYHPQSPTNPASLFSAAMATKQRMDSGFFDDIPLARRQQAIVRCALADWLYGYTRHTRFSHAGMAVIDGAVELAKVDGEVRVGPNGPSSMGEFSTRVQNYLEIMRARLPARPC